MTLPRFPQVVLVVFGATPRIHPLQVLFTTLILVLSLFIANLPGPLAPAAPAGSARPAASSIPPLTYNANILENDTGPSGSVDVGSRLIVSYHLEVPGYPTGGPQGVVRVPGTVAVFATSAGALHVYLGPGNTTIAPGGGVTAVANGTTRIQTATNFNASTNASFSSQGFALLASWPPGAHAISFQWTWTIVAPDGSQANGPWSPWVSVTPDEVAWVAGNPPDTVALGANYPLCLAGPLAGRTFSIHLSTNSPFTTYAAPPVTVNGGNGSFYCWNTTIPSTLPTGAAAVHLWEYGSVAYLMYQLPVQIAANDSPPATGWGGFSVGILVAIGGGAIAAVVVLALLLPRMRTRPASGVAEPRPGPPGDPTRVPPASRSSRP